MHLPHNIYVSLASIEYCHCLLQVGGADINIHGQLYALQKGKFDVHRMDLPLILTDYCSQKSKKY